MEVTYIPKPTGQVISFIRSPSTTQVLTPEEKRRCLELRDRLLEMGLDEVGCSKFQVAAFKKMAKKTKGKRK